MPGPAATIGSTHVCPMFNPGTPPPPHVGGPVTGPGVPNVLIEGKPAAVMGDMCTCAGPPDTIIMGCANVLIGGKPAATVGDMTAHGGSITVGAPTVLIGTSKAVPSAIMPIDKIPFPEIKMSKGANAAAATVQKQLKKRAEAAEAEEKKKPPKIYNLQWIKEDKKVRDRKVLKEITLRADVQNIEDGESVTFTVHTPTEIEGEKEKVTELTGTVKDKKVEVVWEIEDREPAVPYKDEEIANGDTNTDESEDSEIEESITIESTTSLDLLVAFANEHEERHFIAALQKVYGLEINYKTYQNLYNQLKEGKITSPPIEVVKTQLEGGIRFDPKSERSETKEHGEETPIIIAYRDLILKGKDDEAVHERILNKLEDAFEAYVKFLLENNLKIG